jgi:hypothetical protein
MQTDEPRYNGLLYPVKERVGRKTCETSRVSKDKGEAETKASMKARYLTECNANLIE